jgi:hypothetical protein
MKNIHEIITRARIDCAEYEGDCEYMDKVADYILELADNDRIADEAICQLNTQLFRAAGVI